MLTTTMGTPEIQNGRWERKGKENWETVFPKQLGITEEGRR